MKKLVFSIVSEGPAQDYSSPITSSDKAHSLVKDYFSNLDHERFVVIPVNHALVPLGVIEISSGGCAGTVVDPRIVFSRLLNTPTATGFICAHNHPSGSLRPSREDVLMTEKLKAGGEILEIYLKDHLIIADTGYYSFADEGIL